MPASLGGPAARGQAPRVREVLVGAGYSGDRIAERLGVDDIRMLDRSAGPVLARRLGERTPLDVLVRLLLLGGEVGLDPVRAALGPATLAAWEALGLVETAGSEVRARLRVVPHDDLLLVADWPGSPDRAPRPDHVPGPDHPAASLLANVTVRSPVDAVLDLGSGCGIQALLASRHARRVVASDLNPRAVGITAFNAALNQVEVDCREGDLFEPVQGGRFDLIVSNPDTSPLIRRVISGVADLLTEHGICQLLTSWAHVDGTDWRERIEQAFAGCGANAWVLVIDHADLDVATADEWTRYDERERITGVSQCVVTMRRASGLRTWCEVDELPAAIRRPVGDHLLRCFEARELLAGLDDDALLDMRPCLAPGTRLDQRLGLTPEGWALLAAQVRQAGGLPFEQTLDAGVTHQLVRSHGTLPVRELLARSAAAAKPPADAVATTGLPAIKALLRAGFLLPAPS